MNQGKTIIIALVALIVGFGAGYVLRPVIAPAGTAVATGNPIPSAPVDAPLRAEQYFAAHINEARQVVAGCQAGSVRGAECNNAGQAVTEADGRAHFKKFFDH